MTKIWFLLLSLIGLGDSFYLALKHFQPVNPLEKCGITGGSCDLVLRSSYSEIFGIPLAVIGVLYYLIMLVAFLVYNQKAKRIASATSLVGFVASLYFVYIQLVVIGAICEYCMLSAVVSTLLFVLTQKFLATERVWLWTSLTGSVYRNLIKPVLFLFEPEVAHENALTLGEALGKFQFARKVLAFMYKSPSKHIEFSRIKFPARVGLAAGFDYTASLPSILPSLSFGFTTIGTITNLPYAGNPKPRLGRLPRSKSLMVNKGFKNPGADAIIAKLEGKEFSIPVGISIGRTNAIMGQSESVADIVKAFTKFEKSRVKHAYYELNISCPNLFGKVDFYTPKRLEQLITELAKLKITRPVFVKMPINLSNNIFLSLLVVLDKSFIKGVIVGNLQKDRKNVQLVKEEVAKFSVGNFSGKPTFARSNELIKLTRKNYPNRFVIIGCGGVFSASDALAKLNAGADLIQLITGLIFEGPQLVSEINRQVTNP